VASADEAVELALATSPEIRQAEQNVCKARAGVTAAKVDWLPNIAVVGGYANNNAVPDMQTNIGYAGVIANYTFVDWGKRRYTIREREMLVSMATLKVQATRDDVRQKALKAYRDYVDTEKALKLAGELVPLREQAVKGATTLSAKFTAAKDLSEAQVDAVKADLAQRIAYTKLASLIGK
jgi:outer membrane protein TolC